MFRSFVLVASALGRWASVRGALPQPLVAVGVISAGLSARPSYRVQSIIITLVLLRTLGELIHGYGDANAQDDFYDDDEDARADKEATETWDGDRL